MFDRQRKVYLIHEAHNNNYKLCKVLNEYDNKEAAIKDLTRLMSKEIKERDLLKDFKDK